MIEKGCPARDEQTRHDDLRTNLCKSGLEVEQWPAQGVWSAYGDGFAVSGILLEPGSSGM